MSELQCSVCKNNSYLNPGIKMYVSPCFHKICGSCLYKLFQQGYAPCHECGTLLRRINFITSTFEDVEVEREIKMRKLLNRHFLRHSSDFEDEVDYNDYLEEYENLVFEILEFSPELQIREKINLIKSSNSILNPITLQRKEEEQEIKRKKSEISSWCSYKDVLLKTLVLNEKSRIQIEFIVPYLPGGLSQKDVLNFFAYSLSELEGRVD